MKVLLEGERLAALRAYQQGRLIISWGSLDDTEYLRGVAKKYGWPTPTPGLKGLLIDMCRHQTWRWPSSRFKEAFLAKMFESDENFDRAVRRSGIDIYLPD